jgi:phosphatidyl-myo-inositol dimannoside synthase
MKDKLIIFSYDYPPSSGGIARLMNEISIGAVGKFKEVIVLTKGKAGLQKYYNSNSVVKIIYLSEYRFLTEISAIRYLSKIEHKEQYYLICGLWHPEVILAKLAGFKKINVLTHGTELLSGGSKFRENIWLSIYAKYSLNKVNIIANSMFTADLSRRVSPKSIVSALPLAVNHRYFKPNLNKSNAKIIIGTVSRILQFKGHDFILETIKALPLEYKEKIEWHVAGTGPYLQVLKQDVVKYKLDSIVKLKGFIPDDKLAMFYSSLDLFILMTRESKTSANVEGFGLVFLEAQSSGVPVIGTNTGGIPSAIEHKNGGWLIGQDDKKELLILLKKIINNKIILESQGVKARNRVLRKCTWDEYNEKLFKLLR